MVQVDFADQDPDARREYLSEEIERALSSVVPEQRQPFLRELMEQFPSWDARVEVQLRKDESTDRSLTDQRELQDPNFLVARLIDLARELSEKERQVLTERLREGGLIPASRGAWPEDAEKGLRKKLRLPADSAIEATRVLELVYLAADLALRLDELVWRAWQQMAPKSEIRRGRPIQHTLRPFLTGSQDVPRGQMAEDLEKLRQLIASLISGVGQAGNEFASAFLAKFSPLAIEGIAKIGKGFWKGTDEACWQKYRELFSDVSQTAMEAEITQAIVRYAEILMRGAGARMRGPGTAER